VVLGSWRQLAEFAQTCREKKLFSLVETAFIGSGDAFIAQFIFE
jgi:hypothetical protein